VKYLSFILTLYVLLLTAAPNLVEDKYFDEQTTEQNQQGDKNCGDSCSPFTGCDCCHGFTIALISFSVQSFPIYSDLKTSSYHEDSFSEFFSSIWQPPKIG
jgi:hypothetical protein